MSTEAMRQQFGHWYAATYPNHDENEWLHVAAKSSKWEGWQAATANQEALIKAALEVAAKVCYLKMGMHNDNAEQCAEAIHQITIEQVMEKMK